MTQTKFKLNLMAITFFFPSRDVQLKKILNLLGCFLACRIPMALEASSQN